MSTIPIKPQNIPETLIWYYIIGTYPIYFLGAQYIFATFLASFLTINLLRKWLNQTEKTPPDEKIFISPLSWVWIVAVLVIEVSLIVGHLDFDLGIDQIIKYSLTWYRNWGLLALFPLAGHLNIRPHLIYRAVCLLCLQSLIMVLIGSLASVLNIPNVGYTSPLKAFGGVSESYTVNFFYIFDDGQRRLQLFAPWAPALGMVGNIYFFITMQEMDKKWRLIGMVGAVSMIFASVSRLGIVCFPLVLAITWLLTNFIYPWVQFTVGLLSMLVGIISPTLIEFLVSVKEQFHDARAGSSEVRATLQRMAKDLWWNEAPIWGHGRIEAKGPAIAGYRPIGSHHTWFGILYAHGLVGCIALAVAFLWSFIDLLIKAQTYDSAKVGLSILLVMLFFSFAENIESLAYVCWPGLMILGIAFKQG